MKGDIILDPTECSENEDSYWVVDRTKWGEWVLVNGKSRGTFSDHSGYTDKVHHTLEVIGNIYFGDDWKNL